MPTTPMHFCHAPSCNMLTLAKFCAAHAVEQEHSRTNYELRRLYRIPRWKRLRALVLQASPLCPECQQEGRITPSMDVHHKRKATRENFFDISNLEALCKEHHSRHTQRGE